MKEMEEEQYENTKGMRCGGSHGLEPSQAWGSVGTSHWGVVGDADSGSTQLGVVFLSNKRLGIT